MPDPLADLARLEGVPSALSAARDSVDAVLRDRGMRQISGEQTAAALLAGARASSELSGDPDRWLLGSVRLSTELLALASLVRTSPGQALARVHTVLAQGQVPDDELGRVRDGADIALRVRSLATLLGEPTAAPVMVLAVAHAELATVAPFTAGSDLVARAVEHLVLIDGGLDPRAVIVVEAGHLHLRDTYASALSAYQDGSVTGVRAWLLHCAQAVSWGVRASPLVSGAT